MSDIELERVRKAFSGGQVAVADVDLRIDDGERFVLVGPSGSGKSTVLRIIAGLTHPDSGRVWIGGRDVTEVPPEGRDLAMVFQSYALYPHKTVRDNLAFGLRVRRVPRQEIDTRVQSAAKMLGISALLNRKPAQLSGGEQQRVALGRAIVRNPQAFLFDEPLSNLDPQLRGETRAELIRLHDRLHATMVYVTHDQEEAMTLGERIAVLRAGVMEQVDTPSELYQRPLNTFVARFIGSPPMNLLEGRITSSNGSIEFETSGQTIRLGSLLQNCRTNGTLILGVRPHDISIVELGEADLRGEIEIIERIGHAQLVHIALTSTQIVMTVPPELCLDPHATIGLKLNRDHLHLFNPDGSRCENS
jgi:multiple sugar transport system ATP-binding protein